jgi:hypothetical protein
MKAEIEIRGKDLTAQSTNTAKKNIRSVVEEAGKAAKNQKQLIGRMQKEYAQNAYREVARAQRTGIATGTRAAVASPGIVQAGVSGLQSVMQGAGMGGLYNMGAKFVGGIGKMFTNKPTATAHASGGGGGGGGDEGVVGGVGSKIAPALAGVGAVVGAGLGLINSIGKRHDELMSQQEQTYRLFSTTTKADVDYGLSSSRVAQQRLSYGLTMGNEASMKGIKQYTRLAGTFGLSDEEAGKTAAYLNKSGLDVSGAEKIIRGQTNDKIQAKAYFEQLGSILEEASHQGVLSGMKDSDLGKDVARGLSALYGVKVNGQQLSADRAGAISSTITGKFQQASNLEGDAVQSVLFAAVKNQMEKDTGKEADVLDVMERLSQGATGKNMAALSAQMDTMGMNKTEKALFIRRLGGTGVGEARAFADQGFGTAKEGVGEFVTTTSATSKLQAKSENLLLGEQAANIASVRHNLQNKMLDYAGTTAKGVSKLVEQFDELFSDKKPGPGETKNPITGGVVKPPPGYAFTAEGYLVPVTPAPKTTSTTKGKKAK